MTAPFFDKSGTSTVFPGDRVIIKKSDGRHIIAFLRRVWMDLRDDGSFLPSGEIQYAGVIQAMPTALMTKCVRYMGDDYASVAALEYTEMPTPDKGVLVWSTKLGKFINAIVKAVDDDVCLIEYARRQYEAPTADVYVIIKRRDAI